MRAPPSLRRPRELDATHVSLRLEYTYNFFPKGFSMSLLISAAVQTQGGVHNGSHLAACVDQQQSKAWPGSRAKHESISQLQWLRVSNCGHLLTSEELGTPLICHFNWNALRNLLRRVFAVASHKCSCTDPTRSIMELDTSDLYSLAGCYATWTIYLSNMLW